MGKLEKLINKYPKSKISDVYNEFHNEYCYLKCNRFMEKHLKLITSFFEKILIYKGYESYSNTYKCFSNFLDDDILSKIDMNILFNSNLNKIRINDISLLYSSVKFYKQTNIFTRNNDNHVRILFMLNLVGVKNEYKIKSLINKLSDNQGHEFDLASRLCAIFYDCVMKKYKNFDYFIIKRVKTFLV